MGPKSPTPQTQQLFGYPLDQHLNLKHPLIQLAALIDLNEIDKTFSAHFASYRGHIAASADKLWRCSLKILLFRADYLLAAAKAVAAIRTMLGCKVPSFGLWP